MKEEKFRNIGDLFSYFKSDEEKQILRNMIKNHEEVNIVKIINIISNLKESNLQNQLKNLQQFQNSIGAGFHGFFPDTYDDNLNLKPISEKKISILINAKKLLERKCEIEEQLIAADFPINFQGHWRSLKNFRNEEKILSNINIEIDIRAIELLLKILENPSSSNYIVGHLIELDSVKEMLKHRKNLGFIPEPMMNQERLKKLLKKVSENSLSVELWCWLSPWNFFNVADYQENIENYKKLLEYISKNLERIKNLIKFKLDKYIPNNFIFSDSFGITFEWGIRGWVTETMSGCNLEFFKDDISKLIQTIIHELYHRIQIKQFQNRFKKSRVNDIEELIIKRNIGDSKDNKFHEALGFIFAEGTATFVGGISGEIGNKAKIKKGVKLLHSIHHFIYEENDLKKAEELINKGMISNGPFYSIGYYMSKKIVENFGKKNKYPNLIEGVINFFKLYISVCKKSQFIKPEFKFDDKIQGTIVDFDKNIIRKERGII